MHAFDYFGFTIPEILVNFEYFNFEYFKDQKKIMAIKLEINYHGFIKYKSLLVFSKCFEEPK